MLKAGMGSLNNKYIFNLTEKESKKQRFKINSQKEN